MTTISKKWADFGIYAVSYDSDHEHIVKLRMFPDLGDRYGESVDKTRENVVSDIKAGFTFITIIKNSEGKWNKGQPVNIVVISKRPVATRLKTLAKWHPSC